MVTCCSVLPDNTKSFIDPGEGLWLQSHMKFGNMLHEVLAMSRCAMCKETGEAYSGDDKLSNDNTDRGADPDRHGGI